MSKAVVGTDTFWETDLDILERRAGVNLQELMLKANANQKGGVDGAKEIARILGR